MLLKRCNHTRRWVLYRELLFVGSPTLFVFVGRMLAEYAKAVSRLRS